ncbi:MAG: LD-carboxypeptidase [Vicingus serpentipes]|nr:LD-carboxypeptidase [Vicingus serpentipes]
MKKPPYLKKGDKIAIVATARKISKEEIQPAIAILRSWELEPIVGDSLFEEDNQFAGTVKQRLSDLQTALDDESVKAILCARGGYGTVQLIDSINFSNYKKTPKWIIGYSDVTVLHNHINQNLQVQTLHATMPINFTTTHSESLSSLKHALFGEELRYAFASTKMNRAGNVKDIVVGGNLSILYSLTGTNSQINTAGKILFIEDLDEYLYHIDRMMMNLKRAGMLDNLSGLIVGGMSDMNDNAIPYGKKAEEIILGHVAAYKYPVCFNFDAGHTKTNLALVMGGEAILSVGESCSLSF